MIFSAASNALVEARPPIFWLWADQIKKKKIKPLVGCEGNRCLLDKLECNFLGASQDLFSLDLATMSCATGEGLQISPYMDHALPLQTSGETS